MNNTTTTLKEFREIYFNGRYGERLMKRNLVKGYTTTATAEDIEKFFADKLQEVERTTVLNIADRIQQQIEYDDFITEPYKSRVIRSIKRVASNGEKET